MVGGAPAHGRTVYPDAALADLGVQLLAALPGNSFTAVEVLGGHTRADTRSASTDTPCCTVCNTDAGDGPFVFGVDSKGYILVRARSALPHWPAGRDGSLLPIRLTRWLTEAGRGVVCRHACDRPSCIRLSHLILGSQGDNQSDAKRRKRWRGSAPAGADSSSPAAAAAAACASSAERACATRSGPAAPTSDWSWASPSKSARKRARQRAGSPGSAGGAIRPLSLPLA